MLDILRAVAGDIERGIASGMFTEFVSPKVGVGCALVDPIGIHPVDEVVATEALQEAVHGWPIICWYDGAVGLAIRRVWRRNWIILPAQIAVLSITPVAKVWPKTVDCPGVGRKKLALGLEACPCRPELCLKNEPAKGFGATRVDRRTVGA